MPSFRCQTAPRAFFNEYNLGYIQIDFVKSTIIISFAAHAYRTPHKNTVKKERCSSNKIELKPSVQFTTVRFHPA